MLFSPLPNSRLKGLDLFLLFTGRDEASGRA